MCRPRLRVDGRDGELFADADQKRLRALAGILDGEGRCDDELKARREVLATVERLRGKDDLLFGYALVGMGSAYACLGKDHDAETVTRSGVEVLQRVLGPNHPQTLDYLGNVAAFLSHQGRYAEAVEISRHIATLADPVNSKSILPRVHINLGLQLVGLGQFNEAEASFAVALQHAKSGNEKAWVEFGLARAERGLLHAPKAMFHVQRAIALFETYGVPDNVVEALTEEGHLALRLGRVTLALECAERAVTLADHNAGATRSSLPAALLLLGRTLNAKGRSREALVPLERAIALQVEPLGDDAVIWADTRFELAKALASQPDSRSRVERLVSEARQGYAASDRCAEQLRALDAWSRVSLR